jgi:hypothetical protein
VKGEGGRSEDGVRVKRRGKVEKVQMGGMGWGGEARGSKAEKNSPENEAR